VPAADTAMNHTSNHDLEPMHITRRISLHQLLSLFALAGTAGTLGFAHAAAKVQSKAPQIILILGDSLSAEYGLARGTGWVALLQKKLAGRPEVSVVNASISGETTSGGLRRLPALLKQHQPTQVVIELGANDALRGLALKATQDNLDDMTRQCQAVKAKVLIVGMMMPPNFGQRYGKTFAAVFADVAQSRKASLVPFMLKGVADRPDALSWFQPDGLHPSGKAHPIILNNIWPALEALL
jgi:acyl-CoA thioesterase-1